jgi:hypothetical protein
MKPGSIKAGRILLAMLTVGTVFILLSWNHKKSPDRFPQNKYINDTVPKQKKADKEKKIRDLDDALDELNTVDLKLDMEKAQKEIEKAMKEIDGEKIKMQIEQAMKEVDMAKIQKEVQESMGKMNIDMAKMQKEIQESLKDFDGEKIKLELEKSLKEVDAAKIQKDVEQEIARIDWDKMKKELDEVKKIDLSKVEEEMAKVKEEMKEMGPKLEKEMQKAKIEIEKAKEEMKEYKGFVDGLEKDGLIKKSEGYSIKHKDGELIINGKKASNETYLKYRSFLEKHKKFNIEKSDDDFNINVD